MLQWKMFGAICELQMPEIGLLWLVFEISQTNPNFKNDKDIVNEQLHVNLMDGVSVVFGGMCMFMNIVSWDVVR